MASGYHQAQKGRLKLRISQIIGRDVSPDMVHRNEGLIERQGSCLGKVDTHQHCANKTRSIGHRYGIDILSGQPRLHQRLVCQGVDGFHVLAGCNFRHNAAVNAVQLHLRCDAICQHLPSVPDDGNSGFVAGGFHCQDIQTTHSFLRINAPSLGFR